MIGFAMVKPLFADPPRTHHIINKKGSEIMQHSSRTTRSLALAIVLASASLAAGAAGAAAAYSTGFESADGFSPGPIAGQAGWAVFSASSQPNFAQIQTAVVKTGSQAVSVDGKAGAQTGPFYALTIASPGVIDVAGDVFYTTAGVSDSWQFGITGPSLTQFAGGIDIVGNNIQAISGAFPVIGTITDNVWHHLEVILDYTAQTFSVKLDGSTLASGLAFCGSNGACTGSGVASFGDAIFDTFGGSSNFGYLDNFSIGPVPTGGVPEPAAWAMMLLGFGLVGLASRRKVRRLAVATA